MNEENKVHLKLNAYPSANEEKIFRQFADFLSQYYTTKKLLHERCLDDAYLNVLMLLQSWGALTTLFYGGNSQQLIWKQVEQLDLGVYKLYKETIESTEPLDKRIQLILLAVDMFVMSKIKDCTAYLLRIMKSREFPWSMRELYNHPNLVEVNEKIQLIIRSLVKKGILEEKIVHSGKHLFHGSITAELRYIVC